MALLFDEETARLFADDFKNVAPGIPTLQIVIGRGDAHKHLDTLAAVWQQLSTGGMTRHSLLLCIGGGMVTDLGGFAAATFKRGIRFVNVPTTLLAMVDAAVGGKTGINFNGLKNEIGAFAESRAVSSSKSRATRSGEISATNFAAASAGCDVYIILCVASIIVKY